MPHGGRPLTHPHHLHPPAMPKHLPISSRPIRVVHSELREIASTYGESSSVTRPQQAADILAPLIAGSPVECFAVLLLDGKHRPYAHEIVSRGTLTAAMVHPREVFGPAIRLGAAAIIVAHNHPSGDSKPSQEDIAVTARLKAAGTLLGITCLDHIVIGSDANDWRSAE